VRPWHRVVRDGGAGPSYLPGNLPAGPAFPLSCGSVWPVWGRIMLKLALFFLVVSIIAGVFGFSGIAAASAGVAKILFFVAIVIFLVFVVLAIIAGRAIF
jgi:uncharacterized membrane protein YtjA (UPF0391 family)